MRAWTDRRCWSVSVVASCVSCFLYPPLGLDVDTLVLLTLTPPPLPLLYTLISSHFNSSPQRHPPHICRYLTLSSHRITSRYPLSSTLYDLRTPYPNPPTRNSIPPSSLARSLSLTLALSLRVSVSPCLLSSVSRLSSIVSRLVPICPKHL